MRWPPNKAWTSTTPRKGFRHFVAINYGGRGKDRWVSMVSVLDSQSCFCIRWDELKDKTKWISGWMQLSRDEAISNSSLDLLEETDNKSCLHPSSDSGLSIPLEEGIVRPWFLDD